MNSNPGGIIYTPSASAMAPAQAAWLRRQLQRQLSNSPFSRTLVLPPYMEWEAIAEQDPDGLRARPNYERS